MNAHTRVVNGKLATFHETDRPDAFEAVVESLLESIRVRVPNSDGAVLGAGDDDRQRRMEDGGGDVVRVTLERLHAGLVLIVPDLGQLVVAAGDKVGLL